MFGIFTFVMAMFFTMMVLWKRITLFTIGAAGFWVAFLGYMVETYAADHKMQLIVGALAAVVGGLALYGLRVDGNGSTPLQRFFSRLNNDKYEMPRDNRETTEDYRANVRRALRRNNRKPANGGW